MSTKLNAELKLTVEKRKLLKSEEAKGVSPLEWREHVRTLFRGDPEAWKLFTEELLVAAADKIWHDHGRPWKKKEEAPLFFIAGVPIHGVVTAKDPIRGFIQVDGMYATIMHLASQAAIVREKADEVSRSAGKLEAAVKEATSRAGGDLTTLLSDVKDYPQEQAAE